MNPRILLVLVLGAGCTGDPADPIEPGAGTLLRGSIRTDRPVDVAVLWAAADDSGPLVVGTLLAVDDSSAFTIDLSEPPAAETLLPEVWNPAEGDQYGPATPRVAHGYIAAIEPGSVEESQRADFQADSILGWADGYALTYLEGDVEPGTYMEQYLCGAHPAGYHLTIGEIAPNGPFADCAAWPGGSEASGAILAVTPDDLDTVIGIDLCGDDGCPE